MTTCHSPDAKCRDCWHARLLPISADAVCQGSRNDRTNEGGYGELVINVEREPFNKKNMYCKPRKEGEQMETKSVLVTGSQTNGLQIVGPFDTAAEAVEHGDINFNDTTWWVAPLVNPSEHDQPKS